MKRVLILCTGNSARSQMGEGLLRHAAGDRFEVHSAGTNPKGVAPFTIEAMREIGIDVSGYRSKSVDEFLGQEFDYVITVCNSAREACPVFPGKAKRIHWDIADPAPPKGEPPRIEAFRAARDDLRRRIDAFVRAEGEASPAKAILRLPWRKRPALFWRLFRDPRVPLPAKLVLPAMGLYLVVPIDPIPDFIPVLGYLDDLLVVAAGLWLFLKLCPRSVFDEHVTRLTGEARKHQSNKAKGLVRREAALSPFNASGRLSRYRREIAAVRRPLSHLQQRAGHVRVAAHQLRALGTRERDRPAAADAVEDVRFAGHLIQVAAAPRATVQTRLTDHHTPCAGQATMLLYPPFPHCSPAATVSVSAE